MFLEFHLGFLVVYIHLNPFVSSIFIIVSLKFSFVLLFGKIPNSDFIPI